MAECIVCGEKIEDGKKYCSVCEPEPHSKLDSNNDVNKEGLSDEQGQLQENKIEIKKNSVIPDDVDFKDNNPSELNEEEDS